MLAQQTSSVLGGAAQNNRAIQAGGVAVPVVTTLEGIAQRLEALCEHFGVVDHRLTSFRGRVMGESEPTSTGADNAKPDGTVARIHSACDALTNVSASLRYHAERLETLG